MFSWQYKLYNYISMQYGMNPYVLIILTIRGLWKEKMNTTSRRYFRYVVFNLWMNPFRNVTCG